MAPTWIWGLGLVLGVSAVPSVNVALHASFGAPPYLVELLETTAEENATSYFPLLDRIAEGHFDSAKNDEELYTQFRQTLQDDGHLSRAEDLSSFDLAMSLHSTAPRIEAHYQHFQTAARSDAEHEADCEAFIDVPYGAYRFCSPTLDREKAIYIGTAGKNARALPIDRVLGSAEAKSSILYADITSTAFRKFHGTLSKLVKDGKSTYTLRHKPGRGAESRPLAVSGYGVELALKRTDYIVIDDRKDDASDEESAAQSPETTLKEEELSDLRPLSSSELRRLGLKTGSFVMASEDPFETLFKLSQDFPKHSSSIAVTNVSEAFLSEHYRNSEQMPPGYNVLWINGVQIMARDVDAYALLEHLRRERKMINSVRELGLTGPEAIDLLTHEAITAAQTDTDVQRYDWRDEIEGGNVIMWLNDIEKDKRYEEWPESNTALLQRVYPGQLPSVRKDIHNLIIPIDFADFTDLGLIVESIQNFVKRKVPIRFGLVPIIKSPASAEQAKVVYHLFDTYGIAAALSYLEQSFEGSGRKHSLPVEKYFANAIEDRKTRKGRSVQSLANVLEDTEATPRITATQAYLARLGGGSGPASILINGVPIARSDEWLQVMSQRVAADLRLLQQAVYEETVGEEDHLPDLFLAQATARRNILMVPEDDKTVRHIDIGDLSLDGLKPTLSASPETIESELVHLTLVLDLQAEGALQLIAEAAAFREEHDNVEISIVRTVSGAQSERQSISASGIEISAQVITEIRDHVQMSSERISSDEAASEQSIPDPDNFHASLSSIPSGTPANDITESIGMTAGQKAILLNGRIVGPMNASIPVTVDDFEALLSYERKKRLLPASAAIKVLGLSAKASTPLAFAKISNLIALSLMSDIPEGIFEAAPTVRSAVYKKWALEHTAIKVGSAETATIQIVASIDPASETAQRWVPIIKVLSELEGVYTAIYINPKDRIEDLPIKRFYRYVLDSKPTFDQTGAVQGQSAHFAGLPAEALLNMAMDLPPSWLVAPKESVHDLDNIKLSAIKTGADIEAVYALEHILIEGHSRDVTLGPPPRGAQLVLGTEAEPHFADTIVMANLGYFQFKANPGVYNLTLQKGRSEEIFNIDSAGNQGYTPVSGDTSTEIALISFRGATLFPRLSRNEGKEEEDVLELPKSAVSSLASQADKLLSQAGLSRSGHAASKYLSKAARLTSGIFSSPETTSLAQQPHADINIFSVASGHLYERMLNIMMLSVMRHTTHSVKFWFIEQFLSPQFKAFLPSLAAEYGFRYEMVTYKWPHWLRAQKEKQREIWGYKILFLDVLFPLDLDKVIFVDADQIVRTDMYELVQHDLKGAPYGFTPMCDSRVEMEGFRFWKQGYWKNFLRGLPYHISALYVVDLKKFRQIAAGDRLRQQYHQLSADPNSLSNLDQDLPNHMQMNLPIHSLPQEWLWCETWCSDESLKEAKTIDLCNNPQTKEPKLERARRQVPEWNVYDEEIEGVRRRVKGKTDGGVEAGESIQERLQAEDAERERGKVRDEL
nr:hypothetical protein B0A51_02148 [Rachicladosporium sp. CCFEE 5018]